MTSGNLYQASRQWAKRPADERFANLGDLYQYTLARKEAARERQAEVKSLALVRQGQDFGINHSQPTALLTHWSFGQLCRAAGAPPAYLRRLPMNLASTCLEYGITKSLEKCSLLFHEPSAAAPARQIRALTSLAYGRIWDADVVAEVIDHTKDSGWKVPPAYEANGSTNAGLYASDRDVFMFMVCEEDPIEIERARLSRGFFCWNSETGSASLGIMTFLYNYVCGNHIVWGAEQVREVRIIHRLDGPGRFRTEALPILNKFVESRADKQRIIDTVSKAMKTEIGSTPDEVWERLKDRNFTRKEITKAWETAQAEGDQPGTLWGLLQGLTAEARQRAYADSRVEQERKAGQLLSLVQN